MNTDFPNYFLPAVIHHQGTPIDRAYEWRWLQRYKDQMNGSIRRSSVLCLIRRCALAPMLLLASLKSLLNAKRAWLILDLVLMVFLLGILRRYNGTPVAAASAADIALCSSAAREFSVRPVLRRDPGSALLRLLGGMPRPSLQFGSDFVGGGMVQDIPSFLSDSLCAQTELASGRRLGVRGRRSVGVVSVLSVRLERAQDSAAGISCRARCTAIWFLCSYVLQWNSFTALCHRLFLAEPELNPTPWVNSPAVYAVVQPSWFPRCCYSASCSLRVTKETPQAPGHGSGRRSSLCCSLLH